MLNGTKSNICPIKKLETENNLKVDRIIAYDNLVNNFKVNRELKDSKRIENTFKIYNLMYVENGNKLKQKKMNKIRIGHSQQVVHFNLVLIDVNILFLNLK